MKNVNMKSAGVAACATLAAAIFAAFPSSKIHAQQPVKRVVAVSVHTLDPKLTTRAHLGIYARRAGAPGEPGARAELIVEQDVTFPYGGGNGGANFQLTPGEYEVQLQPENGRTVIEKFLVDSVGAGGIPLRVEVGPEPNAEERNKAELIRVGPSLIQLESEIRSLAQANRALTEAVNELKKK